MSGARVLDDAPWLKSGPTARVLKLLNGNGEEARVVGGAVRNALLKIPMGDVDIATTALPDEVIRRAKAAGIKSVPTGIEHGTVTLVIDAHPFEVTTLREDTETFGRKAKVAFGRDWVRDAERRDFTINGLSVDAEGRVHDHVGGLDDIAAKRVRFIGDPNQRIAEDYLRILRFFRIHAAYGAGPARSRRISRMHQRARGPCDALGRTRAHGNAEADGRGRRGRRRRGDGGGRIAAADIRRRRLYRAVQGHDFIRARAGTCAGPGAPAWRARGRRHRGCQTGGDALAIDQCRDQGARFHGPSLVAARRHGRSNRAAPALSARRRSLPRPAAAGVGAVGRRCRRGVVAGVRHACRSAGARRNFR